MLQSDIKRDDRGVDRCNRVVFTAVQNIPNDDSKGYHNVKAHCGMPIVQRISDGVKGCPRCDKEPAVGNVHPRVTSAADVPLTEAQLKECGLTEDTSLRPTVTARKVRVKKAVEAKVSRVPKESVDKDSITLRISLDLLEQSEDVARTLITGASQALDKLPVTNFAESKRLIRLQEKLDSLAKV